MHYDVGYILLLVIVLIAGLILRASLILRFGWVGKDTFYHLLIARQIAKERKLPTIVDCFVEPEHYDYPPLLHVILSKFPERSHKRVQLFAPLFDLASSLIIYLFCLQNLGPEVALIAVAIYSATPFAVDISFSLGPRVVANLFLIICLMSTYYIIDTLNILPLAVAIIAAALVLLTQRLAVQSLIVALLAEAIIFFDTAPLIVLLGAFPIALLLSKGFYVTVLRGHINFVRVMGSRLLEREKRREQSSPILDVKMIVFNLPIIVILPMLVFFPVFLSTILIFALVWAFSLLLLSAFWVFGEGYRHMANSVAPLAIICGIWAVSTSQILLMWSLVFVLFTLSIFKLYRLTKRSYLGIIISPEILEAFQFVYNNGNPSDVILTIPTDLSYHAAYFTRCIAAHSSGGFAKGLNFNLDLNKKVKEGRIDDIVSELKVRWVLTLEKSKTLPTTIEHQFGNGVYVYKYI